MEARLYKSYENVYTPKHLVYFCNINQRLIYLYMLFYLVVHTKMFELDGDFDLDEV
jgi:hypothetical protein